MTGTKGYLGCLATPELVRRCHTVTGIDTGYDKAGWLYNNGVGRIPRELVRDLRHLTEADLAGADAVVHMAWLSNDPLGQVAPHVTYQVNHQGSVRLAEMAKTVGVSRSFSGRSHVRLKQLQHLIKSGQLDEGPVLEAIVTITPTDLPGSAILDLESRADDRGFFARSLNP